MDDSVIMCDDVIESYDDETKTIPANFNVEKTTCKLQNANCMFINYHRIIDSS